MKDGVRIDGQEFKGQGTRLADLLKLRTLPFAMKLLQDAEDFVRVPGLRYPIPPYGIQADPAEGLAGSYGDRPEGK